MISNHYHGVGAMEVKIVLPESHFSAIKLHAVRIAYKQLKYHQNLRLKYHQAKRNALTNWAI